MGRRRTSMLIQSPPPNPTTTSFTITWLSNHRYLSSNVGRWTVGGGDSTLILTNPNRTTVFFYQWMFLCIFLPIVFVRFDIDAERELIILSSGYSLIRMYDIDSFVCNIHSNVRHKPAKVINDHFLKRDTFHWTGSKTRRQDKDLLLYWRQTLLYWRHNWPIVILVLYY